MPGGTAAAVLAATTRWALHAFSTSAALATAAGVGVQGSAVTGVSGVLAFRLLSLPAANQDALRTMNNNTGYLVRFAAGPSVVVQAGTGAAIVNRTRTLVAGDVGQFHVLGFSCNLTNLDFFWDNALSCTVAMAAYAPSAGPAQRCQVMSQASGLNPCTSLAWLGFAGRDSGLTLADFQTICAATKAAGVLSLGGITMSHMWRTAQSPTVPSSFADEIGADALSFIVGSAANLSSSRYSRDWGF
jgi:hypothetical protein